LETSTDDAMACNVHGKSQDSVDAATKSWRIGEDVPWTEIQQAVEMT